MQIFNTGSNIFGTNIFFVGYNLVEYFVLKIILKISLRTCILFKTNSNILFYIENYFSFFFLFSTLFIYFTITFNLIFYSYFSHFTIFMYLHLLAKVILG